MSSEFDRDFLFQQFPVDEEPFDFSAFCNDGDYVIDPVLEAQTFDFPAADAGNEPFDPDASSAIALEPNQASLHVGQSAALAGPSQSDSAGALGDERSPPNTINMAITTAESAPLGPPYKCTEANCRSKAQFKNLSQFQQHLQNIHQEPLLCTWPGCTYRRPFGKECDLERHAESKHGAIRSHICPYESCSAHFDGFKRKDKLLKHLRETHPQVQCQQTHCSAVICDIEQQSHIEEAHGPFECALGHCQFSPPSNFTKVLLGRHLVTHHKISYDTKTTIIARMQCFNSTTITSKHLPANARKPHWEKCSVCEAME
ncbi:unnamed protein product [Clonostachys rosea]|uniref:C2H2-type domain-containing protein n=1 Tax=Bionectria ochroleuca TaxID=29856 RepID=A0ABY6TXX2_BIOOC|nr:unnamed protein product [Clonostachys rosea]